MLFFAIALALILASFLAYALGMAHVMAQVVHGRVNIAGRRYECRDVGPAGK